MNSRWLWLILLLLLQALSVHAVSFDDKVSATQGIDAITKIPMEFAGWQGTDHALDPKVYDILETRSIIHRSYRNKEGREVFLSIVYYAETKVDFHAPEGCLGGSGVKINKTPTEILLSASDGSNKILSLNQLTQKGDRGGDNLVYYFYKTGPFMGRSYLGLRWNLVLNKFRNAQKSGSLIRVSTTMSPEAVHSNEAALLGNFINSLYPYLFKYL